MNKTERNGLAQPEIINTLLLLRPLYYLCAIVESIAKRTKRATRQKSIKRKWLANNTAKFSRYRLFSVVFYIYQHNTCLEAIVYALNVADVCLLAKNYDFDIYFFVVRKSCSRFKHIYDHPELNIGDFCLIFVHNDRCTCARAYLAESNNEI